MKFTHLRRRPRLRAETVASTGAFGEDMHFGVQARAVPVDECVKAGKLFMCSKLDASVDFATGG
jgi:hypothetical protein